MEEVLDLLINNGAMIACLFYFMYRDYKFMNLINETLTMLKDSDTRQTDILLDIRGILNKETVNKD